MIKYLNEETRGRKKNSTLYIRNLNEKIRIDDLKNSLKELFSKYGEIIDIRARNNLRLKGQAFVTMKTTDQATKALENLNEQFFLGKNMIVQYAKTTSEYALLALGKISSEEKNHKDLQRKRKRDEFYNNLKEVNKVKQEEIINSSKEEKKDMEIEEENEIPNKILFLEGISKDITEKKLTELFSKDLEGFVEIRLFSNRGLCFIEYDSVENAKKAKLKLNGHKIGECTLKIIYGKK